MIIIDALQPQLTIFLVLCVIIAIVAIINHFTWKPDRSMADLTKMLDDELREIESIRARQGPL